MNHRTAKVARGIAALALACTASAMAGEGCDKNHFILDAPVCPVQQVADLRMPRGGHTATLLQDGRVLVAGGTVERELESDRSGAVTVHPPGPYSVEIFDPATGSWAFAAPLNRGRTEHAAVLLPDGRVFVVGGESSYSFWKLRGGTAEIYDPATDTWTATRSSTVDVPRTAFTATLLADGRILVAGGWEPATEAPMGSVIYDPASDEWSDGSPVLEGRWAHAAARLADGRVLIVGGSTASYDPDGYGRSGEIVGPSWEGRVASAPMFERRAFHAATSLPDGRVLVTGGGPGRLTEIYDAATGAWIPSWDLSHAYLRLHSATALRDGAVLVAGGRHVQSSDDSSRLTGDVERWSPDAPVERLAPLALARWSHTATLLPDGSVLVVGGYGADGAALTSVERIVPPRGD